jgi:hypothetical protein
MKKDNFDRADRETVLYNGIAVQDGGCLDQFPVLLGLPCTCFKLELQVHISVDDKIWKLVVARGYPWEKYDPPDPRNI